MEPHQAESQFHALVDCQQKADVNDQLSSLFLDAHMGPRGTSAAASGSGDDGGGSRATSSSKSLEDCAHSLAQISRVLKRIEQHSLKHDRAAFSCHGSDVALEWRQISIVLDRVFFTVFLVIICASLVLLFPRPTEI